MAQLAYVNEQPVAIPGMKADLGPDKVITKRAEGANLDIGIGLVKGTTDNDVIKPADVAAQVFKGFSLQSHDREKYNIGVDDGGYLEDEPVNVMIFGSVWVFYTGAPTIGGDVIIAVDAGNEGKIKTGVVSGNEVAATGWKLVKLDAATGLAEISNVGGVV